MSLTAINQPMDEYINWRREGCSLHYNAANAYRRNGGFRKSSVDIKTSRWKLDEKQDIHVISKHLLTEYFLITKGTLIPVKERSLANITLTM